MDDKMYKKPTLIDDVEIYLNLFPIGLVQFLIHLTSDQKNMVNQRSNQLVLTIPIVKWSLSGSKTADAIDSSSSACGSITTLHTFLNENAQRIQ